jgi:hypothetical protein
MVRLSSSAGVRIGTGPRHFRLFFDIVAAIHEAMTGISALPRKLHGPNELPGEDSLLTWLSLSQVKHRDPSCRESSHRLATLARSSADAET